MFYGIAPISSGKRSFPVGRSEEICVAGVLRPRGGRGMCCLRPDGFLGGQGEARGDALHRENGFSVRFTASKLNFLYLVPLRLT